MQNVFVYLVVFSLGLISLVTCFVAEFKRTQKEDIRWDTERNCYIPESDAFELGLASVLCFILAQMVGNIAVVRNYRTLVQRKDGCNFTDLTLPTALLLISWSILVVVVLMLSTAISMSRVQAYGEGWLEEECYLVRDGVFAASGCLAILGLGALTISATTIKSNKQKQQLVQIVVKDPNQEHKRSIEEEQTHDEHQRNLSETVIYLVEEASSTTDISRI